MSLMFGSALSPAVARANPTELSPAAEGLLADVERIVDGRAKVVDPMEGRYGWVSANRLRNAMQTFAARNNLPDGLFWGCSRPTQWISTNQKPKPEED